MQRTYARRVASFNICIRSVGQFLREIQRIEDSVEMQILGADCSRVSIPGDLRIISKRCCRWELLLLFVLFAEADFYLRRALYAIQSWIHPRWRLENDPDAPTNVLTTIITFVYCAFYASMILVYACSKKGSSSSFALLTLVF